MRHKIVIDGDWGGDELQLAAIAFSKPENFEILGCTTVFGNTSLSHVTKNAGSILSLLGRDQAIPLYVGAAGPTGKPPVTAQDGDCAWGEDGKGRINMPLSNVQPKRAAAVDFILDALKNNPRDTVKISATGPLTNIAQALLQDPETMTRVKDIRVMGGCTQRMPANDRDFRQGNITPYSEFNFFMAAEDAQTVLSSGIPVTLFPMNCTQQISFTPEREEALKQALQSHPEIAEVIIGLMKAPEEMDANKFASAPLMHDIHTTLSLVYPTHYAGRRGFVNVENMDEDKQGMTTFTPDDNGNVHVMENMQGQDILFDCLTRSFRQLITAQPAFATTALMAQADKPLVP